MPFIIGSDVNWDSEDTDEECTRLFTKAAELIRTTQDAIDVFNNDNRGSSDSDILFCKKMVELAKTHKDIDAIFHIMATVYEQSEIKKRNFIRSLFEKADELSYPIDNGW